MLIYLVWLKVFPTKVLTLEVQNLCTRTEHIVLRLLFSFTILILGLMYLCRLWPPRDIKEYLDYSDRAGNFSMVDIKINAWSTLFIHIKILKFSAQTCFLWTSWEPCEFIRLVLNIITDIMIILWISV